MLRVRGQTAAQAKKYQHDSLTREGYYSEGQEMAGHWGGRGAARLGLSGRVDAEAYARLCDNLHPMTGEKLTLRMKENRRAVWDFNFNVPKSVSLAYEWTSDERIFEAFVLSIRETMKDIEAKAATRVRKGGQDFDRETKELTWAEYFHFTARPENGMPDPHMHAHLEVFNVTHDSVENCYKAAQIGDILENINHYQAAFHARLAKKLRELGYETIAMGISFELVGVSRSLIEKFSRRGATVEARAKALGITDPAEKDKLAAMTREKKVKDLSKTELHAFWWSQLTPEEKNELNALGRGLQQEPILDSSTRVSKHLGRNTNRVIASEPADHTATSHELGTRARGYRLPSLPSQEPNRSGPVMVTDHDRAAVDFAVKHLFYTASVVTERDLLTEALRWGCGMVTVEGVTEALKDCPLKWVKKDGREWITTAEVILEETRIVSRCKGGHGKFRALNPTWRVQDARLNHQQRAAVAHILESQDFITGIVGKAGVGKTTTLLEAARAIQAGGGRVMAFAPTASASRGTLRESGFPDAETVSSLLVKPSIQSQARGAVWFVDEGGLLSARATDQVLALAERLEARVVLVGDPRQHHSVERGDAFRLLQKHGEMSVVTIDIIQRQSGLFRQGVEQISKGRYSDAFVTFERMNAFHEIFDSEERYKAIAAHYVDAVKAGKSALLVAPTHAECDAVTEKVRTLLQETGYIRDPRKWSILRNLSWSPAQKQYGWSYQPGLVVKTTGHVKGFSLGDEFEVAAARNGEVYIRGNDGQLREFPLSEGHQFSVYEKDRLEIGRGEQVRITVNSRTEDGHRLNNGSTYRVKGFSKDGGLILENGWRLGRDFKFLDSGYTQTSHAAQSRTVDVVLVAQSGTLSLGASDADQFYTTISRGSKELGIYTDSIDGLRDSVARVRERELAMEVICPDKPERKPESRLEAPAKHLGTIKEALLCVEVLAQTMAPAMKEREKELAMEMGM